MKPLVFASLFACQIAAAATEYSDFKVAGCFIATAEGVVLGINYRGQLQLPMGHRKSEETAIQTALRETKEETGIEVKVGQLITTLEDKTVLLFQCDPRDALNYAELKASDSWEVRSVLVMNPHTRKNFDGQQIENPWRFKETEILLRSIYPN